MESKIKNRLPHAYLQKKKRIHLDVYSTKHIQDWYPENYTTTIGRNQRRPK